MVLEFLQWLLELVPLSGRPEWYQPEILIEFLSDRVYNKDFIYDFLNILGLLTIDWKNAYSNIRDNLSVVSNAVGHSGSALRVVIQALLGWIVETLKLIASLVIGILIWLKWLILLILRIVLTVGIALILLTTIIWLAQQFLPNPKFLNFILSTTGIIVFCAIAYIIFVFLIGKIARLRPHGILYLIVIRALGWNTYDG